VVLLKVYFVVVITKNDTGRNNKPLRDVLAKRS
jgi:hypothetical protein